MVTQKHIKITAPHQGIHNITQQIEDQLSLPEKGLCHLHLLHTSAGLALTENSSPAVWSDLQRWLSHLAPETDVYLHDEEGPDDMPAHLKSLLTGSQLTIPFENHRLLLGRWQGIFLFEFRKACPQRSIVITVIH